MPVVPLEKTSGVILLSFGLGNCTVQCVADRDGVTVLVLDVRKTDCDLLMTLMFAATLQQENYLDLIDTQLLLTDTPAVLSRCGIRSIFLLPIIQCPWAGDSTTIL